MFVAATAQPVVSYIHMKAQLMMLMALGAGVLAARTLSERPAKKTRSRRMRTKSAAAKQISAKTKSVRKAARKLTTTAKKRIAAKTPISLNGHARA